jgi:hypothetical protein
MNEPTGPESADQPPSAPAPTDVDDSAPAPPPPDPDHVPYAAEYVVPDPGSQAELARLVPDEPTALAAAPPPA